MTPFIGRDAELARLADLFQRERLVLPVGPPGVGKTRLSREYAALQERAWFCDLTEARDRNGLCRAVIAAAHLVPGKGEMVDAVASGLAGSKPGLLVLDNFEQLVDDATDIIVKWWHAAPQLRFLVTSRRRLGCGEATLDVEPLAALDKTSSGVKLFVALARRVRSSFDPNGAEGAAVVDLVRRLDGVPLAIELAASQMGVLSPAMLLERLEAHGQLAVETLGGLERAIASSLALLGDPERDVLAQCTAFRGGFVAGDAEAVIEPPPGHSVLETLRSLEAQSLLTRTASEGDLRLGMLLSVREAGARKLTAAKGARVRARHAAHYRALCDVLGKTPLLVTTYAPDEATLRRLVFEEENLLVAFDHFESERTLAALGAMVDVLRALLVIMRSRKITTGLGPLYARATAVGEALEGAERLLCELHAGRGADHLRHGRFEDACEDHKRARVLATRLGDATLVAHCAIRLHVALVALGDHKAARTTLKRALASFPADGDPALAAEMRVQLATCSLDEGRLDEAEALLNETKRLDNPVLNAQRVAGLGLALQERGELERARPLYLSAIDAVRNLDARPLGYLTMYLGLLDHEAGKLEDAKRSYEQAAALLRDRDRRSYVLMLAALASIHAARNALAEADQSFAEAEQQVVDVQSASWLPAAMSAFRGLIELGRARATIGKERAAHQERARDLLAASSRANAWELRVARRLLGREIAASDAEVIIDPEGSAFRLPHAEVTRLDKYRSLGLVLKCLVEARQTNPGGVLTADALFAAGWPGEAVVMTSTNRVHVALSKLRSLGLRDVLVRRDDGYLLDPASPVTFSRL
jgi:predicted ATPase